jgi:hypothetical protein
LGLKSKHLHDEESEELLEDGSYAAKQNSRTSKAWIFITLLNLLLLGASLTLNFSSHLQHLQGKNAELKQFSYWCKLDYSTSTAQSESDHALQLRFSTM